MDIEAHQTDNLPLSVREHLMRGQHEAAVQVLVNEHGHNEDSAKQAIEDYRQALRERKIALDIQIMNEQQAKEARDMQHLWLTWGVRIALIAASLIFLYLAMKTL